MKQMIAILLSMTISLQSFATNSSHTSSSPEIVDIVRITDELEKIKKELAILRSEGKFHKYTFYITASAAAVAGIITAGIVAKSSFGWIIYDAGEALYTTALFGGVAGYNYYKIQATEEQIEKIEVLIQSKINELVAARGIIESIPTEATVNALLIEIAALESQIAAANVKDQPNNKLKKAGVAILVSLVGLMIIKKTLGMGIPGDIESGGAVALVALGGLAVGGTVLFAGGATGYSIRVNDKTLAKLNEALRFKKAELEATKKLLESLK